MAIYQNNNGVIIPTKSIYVNNGESVILKINKKYENDNGISKLVYEDKVWIIKNSRIVGDTSVVKQYYGRQYSAMTTNMIQQTNLLETYYPLFAEKRDGTGVIITLQNYSGTQYSWDYSVLYIEVNGQIKKVGGDADTYSAYLQCINNRSDAKGAFFGQGPIQYYYSTNSQRSYPNLSSCDGIYNFLGGAMGSGSNFSLGTGYLKDVSAVVHNLYYYD